MRTRNNWILPVLLLAAGCGAPPLTFGEVEGVVLLNNQPLPEVVVQFLPDPEQGTVGPISEATTDAQGRYRLRTTDKRDGAVVGSHRVVLEDPNTERPPQGEPIKNPSRVPLRYTAAASTPFKKAVQAGTQVINLELSNP